jgi:hypothetical protein
VNRCALCEQDKDEAMLLVQGVRQGHQVCGTCARVVTQAMVTCRASARWQCTGIPLTNEAA